MTGHLLGALEEYSPGTVTMVRVEDRSIGIINADGQLYAVLDVCPHALAPVCQGVVSGTPLPCDAGDMRFGLEGRVLRCPWHKYEFDLSDGGRAILTGYRGRLRMFPVTIADGHVHIDVPARRGDAPDDGTGRGAP